MRESQFQSGLIRELKERFPDCMVLKNDPGYIQGFPDLTILYGDRWAVLECKRSENEHRQPNQEWYVKRLDGMGFASFIFPENKSEVLEKMDQYFASDLHRICTGSASSNEDADAV